MRTTIPIDSAVSKKITKAKKKPTPKLTIIVSPHVFLIMDADSLNDSFTLRPPITRAGKLKYVNIFHAEPSNQATRPPINLNLSAIMRRITPTVAEMSD